MDFTSLRAESKEHKVHFSLRDDGLVIRVQCNRSGHIFQSFPVFKLVDDLPSILFDGHIPWLNLTTKTIEMRPFEQLCEQSQENWMIDCTSGEYRAYKGCETLVDIRSPTPAMVLDCFQCLFDHELHELNPLVTISPVKNSSGSSPKLRLFIMLPHCELSFFVNEREELECRDFKGMVYDENQSVETLFGLKNMLVLRPQTLFAEKFLLEALIPRRVLVRYRGNLHLYDVDTELGCLTGNGDLTSTICLASLHAATGCHTSDMLTDKTGAQAALCLLHSAGCQSIMKLKNLGSIDRLVDGLYPQILAALNGTQRSYYWGFGETPYTRHVEFDPLAAERATHLFQNVPQPNLLSKNTVNYSDVESIPRSFAFDQLLPDRSWPSIHEPQSCDFTQGGHLIRTGGSLPELGTSNTVISPSPPFVWDKHNECAPWPFSLNQLLIDRSAPELPSRSIFSRSSNRKPLDDIPQLHQLFATLPELKKSDPRFRQEYIALLENSVQHSLKDSRMTHSLDPWAGDQIGALGERYVECRSKYLGALDILKRSLGPSSPLEKTLERFGQWPPIKAENLLRCLASTSPIKTSPDWKKCFIELALLLLDLQQIRRLLRFALDGLSEEFSRELWNEVCNGWSPGDYPDWLLIQIQGNFLIRRTQVEIAMQMISPQSGENTVIQVNIGEGKSSVVIPIVAAALANGKQLVRVVVPKALTVEMFQLLVARLGGLVNRPIYHIPISRSESSAHGDVVSPGVDYLYRLMSRCKAEHGILLVQPEDVASLVLKTVEKQIWHKDKLDVGSLLQYRQPISRCTTLSLACTQQDCFVGKIYRWLRWQHKKDGITRDDRRDARGYDSPSYGTPDDWNSPRSPYDRISDDATEWLRLQKWIRSHARDILDESDEILHHRFQLIYTVGLQQHLDGYPDRWSITQQVLRLVRDHIHTLSINHPNSMEYECSAPGSFPHVHIARTSDVGQRLISLIAEDMIDLDFKHLSSPLQDAIRSFISDENIGQVRDTTSKVEEFANAPNRSHLWSKLLLLRGLLASNILVFAISERRWRVDYGLVPPPRLVSLSNTEPSPTMLAVPYRAKDIPAPDTQFGHPDVTIILTCLSYYYTGLTPEQLRKSFEILLDQDDPMTEYSAWIKSYNENTLSDSLRRLSELNLGASEQWDNVIFPLFHKNQAVVDFYLSRVVFPKEAKEFPRKFSTSSWDLAEKRENLITGFSGTNDSRWLLPTSITQHDLDSQRGANARVLAYLLQPENDFYLVTNKNAERRSTLDFLHLVTTQRPAIRVLLDVGAQILDSSNYDVAMAWLDIVRDAAGAIYFNDDNELMTVTRNGQPVLMQSSPLSQRLDRCLVYLDHVHTRGTDLKLPIGSRAAVTLGPRLTKDSLVQGCMRMRKLGHGHSVMFFAPLGVDQSIRAAVSKPDPNARITTADILSWTIQETWSDIQQRAPYWAQQGMQHKSRCDAMSRFCAGNLTTEQLSDAWLQPDTKSLADLYSPRETKNESDTLSKLDPDIQQRCKTLGVLSLPTAQLEEEQEREVNRELEREREVELPPKAKPAEHFLHSDVVKFVKTGNLPLLDSGSAFCPIFTTLDRSTAADITRDADVWSPFILATVDFCQTVDLESTRGTIDQYLRPVQWILTRSQNDRRNQVLVLLSPFEVNHLMPDIRASNCVHLHLYAPRTSKRMKPSDDLKLYVIPPLPSDWTPPWTLIDQLNVFAGQLYLRDYEAYLRVCRFLDVPTAESPSGTQIRWNVYNIPGSFEESDIRFSNSPLPSVMALLAMRTRGRPFAESHMGKILQGQLLTEKDF